MTKSYAEGGEGSRSARSTFRFDVNPLVLTLFTLTFMTSNANATHRLRTKCLELLERTDPELYRDNHDLFWRFQLASQVGRAVMKHGAKTLPQIELRVSENTLWEDYHSSFFETYKAESGILVDGYSLENELSTEQLQYVDEFVSTRLRYSYLWEYHPVFRDIVNKMDGDDLGEVSDFNEEVLAAMEVLVQKGRRARSAGGAGGLDFRTGEATFEAAIRATHAARNKPQAMVKTGCRLMNDMLGGGYEGGRVYVHFGLSGGWKSGLLCSIAWWACDPRFNQYRPKDPTRTPVVLFLTMENDPMETLERMVSFSLGSEHDFAGSDEEVMVRALCEKFGTETCKFSFKYRQNRSISTADLETMIEDEFLDGNEVVMVVMDYIKRIKSIEDWKDRRHLELGAVVDEFSSIAKKYGIPIVTGMQMNREAYAKVEQALAKGKLDGVKELGAGQAGESINVIENTDVAIFQSKITQESTGTVWMTFKRAKFRGKNRSGLEYFAQPFEAEEESGMPNEMRLCADAHLTPRECRGAKELQDGIAAGYDPNDERPGGRGPEDRRADRNQAPGRTRSAAAAGPSRIRRAAPPPAGGGAAAADEEGVAF